MRRAGLFALVFFLSSFLLAGCGSTGTSIDKTPSNGSNSNGPNSTGGTAPNWSVISETVNCPLDNTCAGRRGFSLHSNGSYDIGGQTVASIAPQDLANIISAANPVVQFDLSQAFVCSDRGQPPTSFVADGRSLSVRVTPSGPDQLAFSMSTEGGTCTRGDVNREKALDRAFYAVVKKYDRSGGNGGVVCTDEFVYGINIRVTDDSGVPIDRATGVISQGDYSESIRPTGQPGVYVGAGERAGTYSLAVTAPGFDSYNESGITVTANECHVNPVKKSIVLHKSG